MINDKILQLINKILDSRLPPQTQEEIIRFFLLPRNTPVRSMIELPDEEVKIGTTHRPSKRDLDKKKNPNIEEDEAINKAYKNE